MTIEFGEPLLEWVSGWECRRHQAKIVSGSKRNTGIQFLAGQVRNAAIRLSALIDLLPAMGDLEAEAGGIVLVFQKVRGRNGEDIAGDPAADERRIGAGIVKARLSILRACDNHEVEVAVRARSSASPAAKEIDRNGVQRVDEVIDHLVERLLRRGVAAIVGDHGYDPFGTFASCEPYTTDLRVKATGCGKAAAEVPPMRHSMFR
jgi:hypothetical protein